MSFRRTLTNRPTNILPNTLVTPLASGNNATPNHADEMLSPLLQEIPGGIDANNQQDTSDNDIDNIQEVFINDMNSIEENQT
jgi:hypothetical protein